MLEQVEVDDILNDMKNLNENNNDTFNKNIISNHPKDFCTMLDKYFEYSNNKPSYTFR